MGRVLLSFCLLAFVLASENARAEEVWKVSFAELHEVAYKDHSGIHIDLMRAIAKEMEVKLEIQVVPFARSMQNVALKKADMHIPLLHPETRDDLAPGVLSKFRIYYVYFRAYSWKPIDLKNIDKMHVETEATHIPLFKHKFSPSYCIPCSVRKVALKRLDVYVMAERLVDDVVKREKITGLVSTLYKKFPVRIVFRKDASEEFQEKVHQGLLKVIRSGQYKKIMGPFFDPELVEEVMGK